ncbi:TPA: hypothetical protein ACXJEQ_004118, partial [Escherichia coli]
SVIIRITTGKRWVRWNARICEFRTPPRSGQQPLTYARTSVNHLLFQIPIKIAPVHQDCGGISLYIVFISSHRKSYLIETILVFNEEKEAQRMGIKMSEF